MNEQLIDILNNAVAEMLENVSNERKYNELLRKHNAKLHFVPLHYRVFGGQLQSLNIQFGNFLEKFITEIIANDDRYEIIEEYSGQRSNNFQISNQNDQLIDQYIHDSQVGMFPNLNNEFEILRDQILTNNARSYEMREFKHDIDLLFRNIDDGVKYYVEIKYQDDHDTGKFVDINRKFIKTYAYLTKELGINDKEEFIPILFYFNPARGQKNIYVPEQYVLRGEEFFNRFLANITYQEVENLFRETAERDEVKAMFDTLYHTTMNVNGGDNRANDDE